jgi:4-alpha-glucanotransferase
MRIGRAAGILLHPTSLPGRFGIGDLGPAANDFVEWLSDAHQSLWQILPLGPTSYGNSPYASLSAFAGNTFLISPKKLVDDGLLDKNELDDAPEFPLDKVDYGKVFDWKTRLYAKAYRGYRSRDQSKLQSEFEEFCSEKGSWLDDYALFLALKQTQGGRPWFEWPIKFKLRDERTISIAVAQLAPIIDEQKFYQFLFFRQWNALKTYANERGLKIIGDIPIFVALDSADVWSRPEQFKLNGDGSPKVVAGVPPDFFSKTGQLWGNPIYDWQAMQRDGFGWWIARFRHALKLTDIVRVDHFRGFAAAWEVPGKDKTAEHGEWVKVPGHALFSEVERRFGKLPVVAEDLGVMTPEVETLRNSFDFPGMRILEYAFSGDAKNRDLPHNYVPNTAAYVGTHDNDTAVGWWNSIGENEREYCLKYIAAADAEINWQLIRLLYSSVADVAIVQMQDVLGLGSDARMNTPATENGNWEWRLTEGSLTDVAAARLKELSLIYGRV